MKHHMYHQPNFPIRVEWKKYTSGDLREHAKDNIDKRATVAKLTLDMRSLKLAPL